MAAGSSSTRCSTSVVMCGPFWVHLDYNFSLTVGYSIASCCSPVVGVPGYLTLPQPEAWYKVCMGFRGRKHNPVEGMLEVKTVR